MFSEIVRPKMGLIEPNPLISLRTHGTWMNNVFDLMLLNVPVVVISGQWFPILASL